MHVFYPVKCLIVVEIIIFMVLSYTDLICFMLILLLFFLWKDHFELVLDRSVTIFTNIVFYIFTYIEMYAFCLGVL